MELTTSQMIVLGINAILSVSVLMGMIVAVFWFLKNVRQFRKEKIKNGH